VFALLDPDEFRRSFMTWVHAINELGQGQVVAVDGKQLRGSQDKAQGREAINLVSAWASANQLVLGQVKVEENSNEITAIPQLLQLLNLEGCLVTVDAISTQTQIARQIVEQGGDYLLEFKENQGHLYENLEYQFRLERERDFQESPFTYAKQVSKGHRRLEIRQCWATSDPEYLAFLSEGEKVEIKTR
jgi:predicted transposase YbfD/YdcC